jgi:hypothetical protein
MKMIKERWLGLAICLAGALALAPGIGQASATFTLTSDHCSPFTSGGTDTCLNGLTNGGTITVTDDGGGVGGGLGTLSFDIELNPALVFVHTGFPVTVGFQLGGGITSIQYTSLLTTVLPFTNPGTQNAGAYHMDGLGTFNYGLVCTSTGGSDNCGSSLTFSISALGLDITDLAKSTGPGPGGQFFGIDVLNTLNSATGPIDASTGSGCGPACGDIPEPQSLALVGLGFVALGMVRRRRNT